MARRRSPTAQPTGQPTVAVTTAPAPEAVSPGTVVPPAAPGSSPVQRGPRKARLQIRQVDPWSVMKLGFLLSLALGIVFVVAVALLWSLLDSGGVFDSINKVVADVANDQTDFTVQGSLAFRRVMGVTLVLAVVQVVLITALATLAAFLYNLAVRPRGRPRRDPGRGVLTLPFRGRQRLWSARCRSGRLAVAPGL